MRETCTDTNFHAYCHYGHSVTRLQEEEEEDGKNGESHFTCNTHKFCLDLIFCIQFICDVFSTVMSPKDVLIEAETGISLCMGIMQEHP